MGGFRVGVIDATVLVFHDLVPAGSPLRAMLRRLLVEAAVPIDVGSRTKPLPSGALLREVAERAPARVFTARNAQILRAGDDAGQVRSVVPIAHPVLLTLRQYEHWARQERPAAEAADPDRAADTARIADALAKERPAYPFCNLQAGFFAASGQAQPRARPATVQDAIRLAEGLGSVEHLVLPDFPGLMQAELRPMLVAAGVAVNPPAPAEKAGPGAAPDTLVAELTLWRERLPPEVFQRLCELNRADLMLLDHVVRLHAERLGAGQAVRGALAAAAEITGHRRAPAARPPRVAASSAASPAASSGGRAADGDAGQVRVVEADPVLGWRNRAHSTLEVTMLGRRVLLDTDASGCRVVAGQPGQGERTLAIYGCSLAFGWGVAAEATFASLLQARWPRWRVENHGINAHGTVHNYLALQRNQRWSPADHVTFCWAGEHRRRNVADLSFVLTRTPRGNDPAARVAGEMTPRATLDEAGRLVVRPVAVPRPDLREVDLADFAPDPYLMELVSFRLIESAAALVRAGGGDFFLTVLRSGITPLLQGWLDAAAIPVVHALLPSDEYTNLPDDHHPNAAGHEFYADRIDEHLRRVEARADAARLVAAA